MLESAGSVGGAPQLVNALNLGRREMLPVSLTC